MIDIKPKTYNEIVRLKKCYTLANYYNDVTENLFNEIYNFLGESPMNSIVANQQVLSFVDGASKVVKTVSLTPKNFSFDSIKVGSKGVSITPHYEPNYYGSGSSGSSFGGSTNNNNNNNNNNK